jgi:hypothetical protein
VQYLVKWENYPEWEATWEPINNLKQAKEAINEYEETIIIEVKSDIAA